MSTLIRADMPDCRSHFLAYFFTAQSSVAVQAQISMGEMSDPQLAEALDV
ncbi:MAG TPA: hypothetical protein VGO04_30820 [Ensifer sp.]|jgi:hypothetical protein|nr:hypothetical protein [Ensifer sp.]